jgi:plastocyanin
LKLIKEIKHEEVDPVKAAQNGVLKRRPAYQPLSVFSKTSIILLLVIVVLIVFLGVAVHQPLLLIIAGILLLIVTFIMTGVRWAPLMSSILGGLILLIFTSATSYPIHHLSHPKDAFGYGQLPAFSFAIFVLMCLVLWSAGMLIAGGLAAVAQNYVQRQRQTPIWYKTALTGAICLLCGGILLGAISQPEPPALATTPNTVLLQASNFSQSSITIAKGTKLTLIDNGSYHHNINNGQWINGQPRVLQEAGAPKIGPVDIDTAGKSISLGPFTTAGTYHLICSLHHGMSLTVTVQ